MLVMSRKHQNPEPSSSHLSLSLLGYLHTYATGTIRGHGQCGRGSGIAATPLANTSEPRG